MEQVRTLPLRVALADGESLHSWLLRLAYRNGMPLPRLAPVLGLSERLRVPHNYALSRRLPTELLRRIETQTGLAPSALDAAVLDQFDPLGWKPIAGSRYCTGCLTETSGVWPMRWQLPYTFACLRHRCLLAAVCPCCRRAPNSAGMTLRAGLLPSTRCVLGARRETRPCDADLLSHPWEPLPANDARLAAQEWVNQRLDHPTPATVSDLRDLDALAIWFRHRIEPAELTHLGAATVTAMTEYRDNNHGVKREQPSATVIAGAMTVEAIGLITADDTSRHRRFAPLLRDVHTQYRTGQAPSKRGPMILSHKRMTSLSEPLQHKLLHTADAHLPVSERLRYRTCTPSPRPPQPGSTTAADRARHIPQYLWHDWIVRLRPPCGTYTDEIAVDIPTALMIPGNPARNIHATGELNLWRAHTSQTLVKLTNSQPYILAILCALAEYLDTHGAPIDYRRRRTNFTDIPLAPQQWHQLCTAAGTRPSRSEAQLLHARRYMFQLLTGADLNNPKHLLAFGHANHKQNYLYFIHNLTTPLRQALHQHAHDLLHTAGIDEPLTWSPPGHIAAGYRLPGRDPADIDMNALHQAIIIDNLSTTAAAAKLGVSFEHIRYATQFLHRLHRPRPRNPRLRIRKPRAVDILTADFFQREHIGGGKDLPTLCAETGYSAPTLRRFARQAGIELVVSTARHEHIKATRPRARDRIDPDWLREQVVAHNRTNGDIGAELGLSHETIRRRRKDLGIAAHPFGSAGHIVTNLRHPELPRDIRRAVEGQRNGWQRLLRFQQMLEHPSMNSAAQAMGLHTQNLNLQLQRLETDIGGQLLHRAPHRYAPMVPTARGQRLLKHLAQPDVIELLDRYANVNAHPKSSPNSTKLDHFST